MKIPEVDLKEPAAPENYDRYEVEGIVVYVPKNIEVPSGTLRFSLSKFFFIKSIVPHGLEGMV